MTAKDLNEFCAQIKCNGKCEKCRVLSDEITKRFKYTTGAPITRRRARKRP